MVLTTKLGAITVKVPSGLVTPATDAVIAPVPGARAEATPVPLIVATVGVADAQVTKRVISRIEPSAKVPVAVNCPATPSASSGSPGEIAIDTGATFVRLNEAAAGAPPAMADTVWLPATSPPVAMTLAVPLAPMVAGLPLMVAEAPPCGAVKSTWPPATGSIGLLAVTVATRGWAKGPLMSAVCPLPDVIGDGEPARLEGADVDRAVDDAGEPALVGGDACGNEGVVARVNGRAAGQQGHGLGRATVIAQGCQQGIERIGDGAGQVGADPAGAAVGLAYQVVAQGRDTAIDVRTPWWPHSRRRSCCPDWSCPSCPGRRRSCRSCR